MTTIICLALLFTCSARDRSVDVEPESLWSHPAVRVSRIFLPADDRSTLHRHHRPFLIVPLQESPVLEGEYVNSHIAWHERSGNVLVKEAKAHALYNPGPNRFVALEIEIRAPLEARTLIPRFSNGVRFQKFDLPGFEMRRYRLSPGEVFTPQPDCQGVTVAMAPALLRSDAINLPMMAGDIVPSGAVTNAGGPAILLAICAADRQSVAKTGWGTNLKPSQVGSHFNLVCANRCLQPPPVRSMVGRSWPPSRKPWFG